MFMLLRYFSAASLAGFVIVTALLGFLYRQTAITNLTDLAEEKNVVVTQGISNSLWAEVAPFLESTRALDSEALRVHPNIATLRESVVEQIAGLSVVKVKIYNPDGVTVFSTETEQIGESEEDNAGFISAWNGQVISELTHRDSFNTFDGVIENQDVLATYIPIHSRGDQGAIIGVIELYSNVTPLLQRVNRVQRNVILGVAAILAALYGALVLIVYRADRILRAQYLEGVRAEGELRQQQRSLATYRERERLARELHDSLGQVLGYVKMQSQAAIELYQRGDQEQGLSHLQRLIDSVQSAHVDVREYIMNLQTSVSEDQDFVSALESHLNKFSHFSDIHTRLVKLTPTHSVELQPAEEAQLMRIVQEALTNVRKHAQASQATVTVEDSNDALRIIVADNGRGFSDTKVDALNGYHVGLKIMRERAAVIGGKIDVESGRNHGTQVIVTLPKSECRSEAVQRGDLEGDYV